MSGRIASSRLARSDGLEERVLRLDKLTAKQERLARVMLEDELFVAFASAEDVAKRAGVDAATVVRFSRLLGYVGFADLREDVRKRVPGFITAAEKVRRTLEHPEQTDDVLSSVYMHDVRNIEETARQNAPETLNAAIEALDRAEQVFFIGMGRSAFVAEHLAHELALLGVRVHRRPPAIVDAVVDLAGAGARDVVVSVGVWRYLKDIPKLLESARDAGATTIALTDSRLSPVARLADILLVAATETPELGRSITALMTLSNVIATGVAMANPGRALERLKRVDEFYERFDVMTS